MIRRLSALSVALLFCASTTIAQQNVQLPIEGKVINLYDGNSVTVLDFKKDFGGVCDGNTDDQPALDRAIEFINSLDKTVNAKGTTLQMPSGFCMLKKTWFIKRAMTVRGMGGGRDRAATTLVWPKGTVGIVVQSHDVAGDNGYGEGVSFEDFTVNALGPESPMVGT